MNGEVIAIGDELTSGVRLDTNTQWLSERLGGLGIRVLYHATVGDDLEANIRVFREALDRSDVIVCTGGLGPTADDLTREAIAAATGRELAQDDDAVAHIERLFATRKRKMPERNLKQALFPVGSRVVHNPHGTAPGIDIEVPREGRAPSRLFALPGVPAEMKEMWEQTVARELTIACGGKPLVIRHRTIKCFGVGESDLEMMLPDVIRRGRVPSVGITVSHATISLRITAEGDDETASFDSMQPTIDTIHEKLGNLIFGYEFDELQHAVVRLLREKRASLSVVEWGTGGLLAHWLSDEDLHGDVFLGGDVIRNDAAASVYVDDVLTDESSDADAETTLMTALAEASRRRFQSDYALAVGPFPRNDSQQETPGDVDCVLVGPKITKVKGLRYSGHPDILQARTAKSALNLLRMHLINN